MLELWVKMQNVKLFVHEIVRFRLFSEHPELLQVFPKLKADFPAGRVSDRDKFRANRSIQRHGSIVVSLLDKMIIEFDNHPLRQKYIRQCVDSHIYLKEFGMKGDNFKVKLKNIVL